MKRTLLLPALATLLLPCISFADTAIVDGIEWTYSVSDGKASIEAGPYTSAIPQSTSGSVTIPSTLGGYPVTSIGSYAFYDCFGLTSLMIPDSVTSIENYAFWRSGLTSVTIPNSVTNIEFCAFRGCSGLTSITIPNSVTSIGNCAFEDCSGLASVMIGNGVTRIGGGAFNGCPGSLFDTTTIPGVNLVDGWAFGHTDALSGHLDLTGIRGIADDAFSGCSGLTSVTIPDSVASIGGNAFYECSGMTSVTIGNGVTSIGEWAFSGCSGLTSVTIPDSVTSIGDYAFSGCSGLTSVTIPDSVTSIGGWAFNYCSGLTSVTIGNGVTSIGDCTFIDCSGLTSVTIGNGVKSIGGDAFDGCSGLTSVTISDSVTSIGSNAFRLCSRWNETIVNISSMASWATNRINGSLQGRRRLFLNGSELSDFVVPNGVTSIVDDAFSGCSGLASITIPDSVTNIGDNAFYGCSGLTEVHISDLAAWYNISFYGLNPLWYAHHLFLGDQEITDLVIPDGVTSIKDYAFSGCSGLASVTIPNSVTRIGSSAFSGCSGLASITIPNSVTNIGGGAFNGCSDALFDKTSIPGVVLVDGWAVGHTDSLPVDLDLTGVRGIAKAAFYGCYKLTSITIPNSVTIIIGNAFDECIRLEKVHISDLAAWCNISFDELQGNPLWYAHHLFLDDQDITNLVIPDGVTSIGDYAFVGCSGLTSVTIPDSVMSIGDYAFLECSEMTSVAIGNGVTSIGNGAFDNCSGLTSVTIPDSVTSIGNWAFVGCSGLTSITIPDSVTRIGDYAFSDCSGLTSIAIPDSVTSIGDYAFDRCFGLTSVTIPDSVTNIGHYAFSGCSGLKTLYLPNAYSGETPYVPWECTIVLYDELVSFSVASPFGQPVPDLGNGLVASNVVVSCSVSSPVQATDGVRYVCTGWRGTGSVPASGTGNAVDVLMLEDSSIEWLWETNVWIECEVTGNAALSGTGSGWFRKDGTAAVFSFVPAARPFAFRISGDTDEVSVDAETGTVSIPTDRPRAVELHVLSYGEAGETGGKPLDWTDDAEAPWFAVADATATDGFSLRSGEVAQGGTSALGTTVTGPGRLSFAWRFDAGRNDFVRFYVDDAQQAQISREATAWMTNEVEIAAGEHTLRWTFVRGSTAGGAGFLDDVRWTPLLALTVTSAAGTPTPAVGSHDVFWGSAVEACVEATSPTAGGKTRHVCTGWTGTGSVPASGTGTNVAFTVEEDSSLTWNWRTEHWIDVAVASGGSTSFQPQWATEGGTVYVSLSSNWSRYDIALSGDTNGVTRSGSTLYVPADGPRTIHATITERKVSLTVSTPMGEVSPSPGTHLYSYGDYVTATAVSPLREANGEQVVCAGWTGSGWVSSSGTGTSRSFYIYDDSSITWKWATNVWIDVAVSGGSTSFQPQWVRKGTIKVVELSPLSPLCDITLSGDVADGVELDGTTLRVLADKPRTIRATITERKVSLTVSTPMGEVSPAPGTHLYSYGNYMTATAVSPLREANGEQVVCAGWTGTGSVSSSGTGASKSFYIYEDSSITWKWATNVWIDVAVSGGSTSFSPQWVRKGTTAEIELTPATHLFTIALSGDVADGVELDGTTLRVLADKPRTIRATIAERKVSLAVSSAFGTATPTVGTHVHSWGDAVSASVVAPPTEDGTRRVCLGWTGTGSVPASGSGTAVSFTMETDSTLSWRWRTDRWISVETAGPVETDFRAGWCAEGETLEVAYDVLFDGDCAVALAGDTNGIVHDAVARTLAIPCDRVRAIRIAAAPKAGGGGELDLAEALDAPGLAWTSEGANAWTPQTATTKDGEDAAESGDAAGGMGHESILSMTVTGPGTFSWSWRVETTGNSGIDLEVDETPETWIDSNGAGAWVDGSVAIAGAGTHEVRFVFWNEGSETTDRGFVDRVSWSGAVAGSDETSTTPVPVPHAWLVANGCAAAGASDAAFEAAALAPAANGRPVWECYVAGLDPTKDEDFLASIDLSGGEPVVSCWPSNIAGRVYTVWGKATLTDGWSSPVNAAHHFFQVRVSLNDAGADSFDEPVVVTFDPAGGTVDPATKTYAEPGALGALPTPVRDGFEFLGWWTRETGGVRVDETTAVPWSNWTLFARWRAAYAVRFESAGGTGEMPEQTFLAGTPQALSSNAFERVDYDFVGWATEEGGAVVYADGETVADLTATPGGTVTLWAVWRIRDPLASALNPALVFTKGGNADWFAVSDDTHDGVAAARSGSIAHGRSTWIETTVNGPGTVTFWWKVSSEGGCDYLLFYIDESLQSYISGTGNDWSQKTFSVSSAGSHVLRWTYRKDGSDSSGSDCGWVDEVVWTPAQ